LGRTDQAQRLLGQGLRRAADTKSAPRLLAALPGAALALADRGQVERAVEVYALACRFPLVARSHLFDRIAGQAIVAAAQSSPPHVVAEARARGQNLDVWATVETLLGELGDEAFRGAESCSTVPDA
jgi:hypothetical protein